MNEEDKERLRVLNATSAPNTKWMFRWEAIKLGFALIYQGVRYPFTSISLKKGE